MKQWGDLRERFFYPVEGDHEKYSALLSPGARVRPGEIIGLGSLGTPLLASQGESWESPS